LHMYYGENKTKDIASSGNRVLGRKKETHGPALGNIRGGEIHSHAGHRRRPAAHGICSSQRKETAGSDQKK